MMQKIRTIALLGLCLMLLGKSWHTIKQGFSITRIEINIPKNSETTAIIDPSWQDAFHQNYRYLSRGHQCYAFISDDGRYVLKFPRSDRYRLPFWLKAFPFFNQKKQKALSDKIHRYHFIMKSFDLAEKELKKETALLMLHLQGTNNIQKTLQIQDRTGQSYSISLDQTSFILQKKGDLIMPLIRSAIQDKRPQESQKMLLSFLDLVFARAQKGIFNKDASFLKNFALCDDQAVQIDIGSFYYPVRSMHIKNSFRDTVEPVKKWLQSFDTDMAYWFEQESEKKYSAL